MAQEKDAIRAEVTAMSKSDRVRADIVSAAKGLFETIGYDKTSLEDIAHQLNKTKTSVYYHFPNKLAIFEAVIDEEFSGIESILESRKAVEEDGARFLDKLAEYFETRIDLLSESKIYGRYALETLANPQSEAIRAVRSRREAFDKWEQGYFSDVCSLGIRCGAFRDEVSPEAFASMLSLVLMGVEFQIRTSNDTAANRKTFHTVLERILIGMGTHRTQKKTDTNI